MRSLGAQVEAFPVCRAAEAVPVSSRAAVAITNAFIVEFYVWNERA